MLSLLHIENIALIDRADISFGPGFNVLTGETGAEQIHHHRCHRRRAGRADQPGPHPHGEKSALVTALFQKPPNLPWFQENGVGPDENGELVISRKIQGMEKTSAGWGACPVPFSS